MKQLSGSILHTVPTMISFPRSGKVVDTLLAQPEREALPRVVWFVPNVFVGRSISGGRMEGLAR